MSVDLVTQLSLSIDRALVVSEQVLDKRPPRPMRVGLLRVENGRPSTIRGEGYRCTRTRAACFLAHLEPPVSVSRLCGRLTFCARCLPPCYAAEFVYDLVGSQCASRLLM